MTLVINLTVNRQEHIATVKVSRLEPLSYDQEIYTYEVELHETRSGTRHISRLIAEDSPPLVGGGGIGSCDRLSRHVSLIL